MLKKTTINTGDPISLRDRVSSNLNQDVFYYVEYTCEIRIR